MANRIVPHLGKLGSFSLRPNLALAVQVNKTTKNETTNSLLSIGEKSTAMAAKSSTLIMTSTGHLATSIHENKEFDSVKESVRDVIKSQDIDPARLSSSPVLDTHISFALVTNCCQSSVEECHSPSHSVPGSQHSLEPPSSNNFDRENTCYTQSHESFAVHPRHHASKQDVKESTVINDVCTMAATEDSNENCRNKESRNPLESTNLNSTVGEGSSLTSPDHNEVTVQDTEGEQEPGATSGATERGFGRSGCCGCSWCWGCSRCCLSGCLKALCSTLVSVIFLPLILYVLYVYLPMDIPYCPDLYCCLILTLRCCAAAAVPIFLVEDPLRRSSLMQLFVASSVEQLFLFALNLAVMATFLHEEQLRAVPILSGVFVGGRLIYWLSLHVCSTWRGFGSGLTVFPLLAMVIYNLYHLLDLILRHFFQGSEETLSLRATSTAWPLHIAEQLNDYFPTMCPGTQKGQGYC